ncbi:PREDICTED: solute carrier family 35 member E3-like [Dufourea novaeangliae]|uniref:Solute carrier family 35 member E3 n=1 Tax=Dufourea novaeangliae TaxID=178035 RepID=A0A154PJH2_DUFNO|nr:PREDICTED: solute carrier family 35 member E3-like [Dufourea novaeangliae]KZC11418.1 Solute carrier family 35 member E3 [Dufourea novaeangliae]
MNKNVVTAFYLVLNTFFSIVIVLLNKWLYIHISFPIITLSMIHFLITFVGLIICERFDIFCIKDVALKEMLWIAFTFCGFVVLTNLSLAYNTVGTYQVAKMLTTPCVIILQIMFYKKHYSVLVKLTLIPIILGVTIFFYHDIQFNVIGIIYATMGVFVTSLYQVMLNTKQKEFQMDPMQLLYYQAPLSAIVLLIIVPVLEPVQQTFARSWSLIDLVMVVLSGIVAFFVNLTSYWIIGKTSPLTYNMVGHTKFCLLLLGGSLIFHETLAINHVIGITLTLIGIILYAHVKMKDVQIVTADYETKERKLLHKI